MYNSSHWAAGRMNAAGYAPLALVYRIVGRRADAIEVADRGINFLADAGVRAHGTGAPRHAIEAFKMEAARCVAARALAVFENDPPQGIQQMRVAIEMGANDRVVAALAKQLNDFLERAHQGASR